MKRIFWELSAPEDLKGRAEWDDSVELGGPIYCSTDPGHQRAGKRLTNLSVILPQSKVEDFVWTWYSECLIQDHVLELFQKHEITGYEVKPVKARFKRKSGKTPPRLWELVVTGWAGIAPDTSGIRLLKSCPSCGLLVYSNFQNPTRLIDEDQWDGSDIFMVWPLPRYVFVTERIVDLIKSYKLTGALLHDIEELRPLGLTGTLSPGRLSYSMPEPRARELGESLGIY